MWKLIVTMDPRSTDPGTPNIQMFIFSSKKARDEAFAWIDEMPEANCLLVDDRPEL